MKCVLAEWRSLLECRARETSRYHSKRSSCWQFYPYPAGQCAPACMQFQCSWALWAGYCCPSRWSTLDHNTTLFFLCFVSMNSVLFQLTNNYYSDCSGLYHSPEIHLVYILCPALRPSSLSLWSLSMKSVFVIDCQPFAVIVEIHTTVTETDVPHAQVLTQLGKQGTLAFKHNYMSRMVMDNQIHLSKLPAFINSSTCVQLRMVTVFRPQTLIFVHQLLLTPVLQESAGSEWALVFRWGTVYYTWW